MIPARLIDDENVDAAIDEDVQDAIDARVTQEPPRPQPWSKPSERLPDEGRAVFFMTDSGHWAGERQEDVWVDWGDKGAICYTSEVLIWQYAPDV